jgi:hemin uptake protein HemP
MKPVYGTFLLSEKNNEYRGEYFNNHSTEFIDENIRIVNSQNLFQGTFETEWIEKGQKYLADLTITLNASIYSLNWTRVRKGTVEQNVSFIGRGVIKEGKLVAVYQMI